MTFRNLKNFCYLNRGVCGKTSNSHGVCGFSSKGTDVYGKSSNCFWGEFINKENKGSNAVLKIKTGSQVMLIDGNEIDVLSTGLYLNNNSSLKVIVAKGGGNVSIGVSSPSSKLDISSDVEVDGAVVYPSDRRLKKNIDNALEKIMNLRDVEFEWRKNSAKTTTQFLLGSLPLKLIISS